MMRVRYLRSARRAGWTASYSPAAAGLHCDPVQAPRISVQAPLLV